MNLSAADIQYLIHTCKAAGAEIMNIYQQDFEVYTKSDESPLTLADQLANDVIIQNLTARFSQIPYISEETKTTDYTIRKTWKYCWIIDPLDGTKEFIKKNDEFTVNIALVEDNTPIAGFVYAPALDLMYFAIKDQGAFRVEKENNIRLKAIENNSDTIRIVASRSHLSVETEAFVKNITDTGKKVTFVSKGSSLKFCIIAEGDADMYPRLAPTMEWDTAAAQLIATESGKNVIHPISKNPLTYNKENLLNDWFVVC